MMFSLAKPSSLLSRSVFVLGLIGLVAEAMVVKKSRSAGSPAPDSIQQIDLVDLSGRTWQIDDFNGDAILVVAVLRAECPLAQHYANRLQTILDQYRDQQVGLIAVMSNRHDSFEQISSFANRQSIEYPILIDADHRFADRLGAERTPEIFVFDSARQLRYRGRVDDQFGVNFARQAPRRHDLAVALDELLAGNTVSVPRTKAIGCIIGRAMPIDSDGELADDHHLAQTLNHH